MEVEKLLQQSLKKISELEAWKKNIKDEPLQQSSKLKILTNFSRNYLEISLLVYYF